MSEFWENLFINEKTAWGFEPSDSAQVALGLFTQKKIRKILVPGAGYGRNASIFYNNGFDVTGIEISPTAIQLARKHGYNFPVHCGSVLEMPFDSTLYDGIFCYALLHLFNRNERRKFLSSCFNQLRLGGYMVFTVVSTQASMFGSGKCLSKNRYKVPNGLGVYFYDKEAAFNEFNEFGFVECREIDEPIRHMKNVEPLKCLLIICKKEDDE